MQPRTEQSTTSDGELLAEAANALLDLHYVPWRFGDSVAFEGMVDASRRLGDPRWRDFAHGFFRCWAASVTEFNRRDCTAPGLAFIKVYEDTKDVAILDAARRLADYLQARPRIHDAFATFDSSPLRFPRGGGDLSSVDAALLAAKPAGVYVDCLHFDPPLFAGLAALTGDQGYLDEAIRQAAAYISLLQDPDTGLFHHFYLEGSERAYTPTWGRGQGWALLGLVDVLRVVPLDHPQRAMLCNAAVKVIEGVLRWQCPDGSWYALIDDSTSGLESSTAAFMIAGIRRAIDLGLVTDDEMREPLRNARRAVLASVENGILRHASDAVQSSTVLSHYPRVPVDVVSPWSQGCLVVALAEK